jgi:hypothetical protein
VKPPAGHDMQRAAPVEGAKKPIGQGEQDLEAERSA